MSTTAWIILTILCLAGSTVLLAGIMYQAGRCDREIDLIEPDDLRE